VKRSNRDAERRRNDEPASESDSCGQTRLHEANIWHVRLDPDPKNGLTKTSTVDALQLRGLDQQRFIRRLGHISDPKLDEVLLAIAAVIEYA
jgi:mRNA-degrading endonuclease toxin of MazEF toxin-antitoxin module